MALHTLLCKYLWEMSRIMFAWPCPLGNKSPKQFIYIPVCVMLINKARPSARGGWRENVSKSGEKARASERKRERNRDRDRERERERGREREREIERTIPSEPP